MICHMMCDDATMICDMIEARKRTLQQLSKNLERADSLLRDMEQEVASIAKRDIRDKLNTRLKTVSGDIAKTRSEFEAQKNRGPNSGSERDSLLGSGGAKKDEFQIAEDDYRSRLAQSTRSVERTSDSLQRSMQILDETEQMGVQTAEDVKRQGEQLRRTRDRLHDANEELTVGSRIIGRLSRRQITNRIIIILIILLMLVVIGILVFFIVRPFVKKKKDRKSVV